MITSAAFVRSLMLRSQFRMDLVKNMYCSSSFEKTKSQAVTSKEIELKLRSKDEQDIELKDTNTIEYKIEMAIRYKKSYFNAPQLANFTQLLTRDPSNLNQWVKVSWELGSCKKIEKCTQGKNESKTTS